ncbi:Ultraviolet-B receptor UVR8 [Glycine soja]
MPMEDEVMSEVAAPPRLVFLVSAGASHSVALLTGNVVCSWGRVEDGQLGHGDTDDRLLPTKLSALDGQDIICVTCGADHTMARSESGRDVYSWGWYYALHLNYLLASSDKEPKAAAGNIFMKLEARVQADVQEVNKPKRRITKPSGDFGRLGHGDHSDMLIPHPIKASFSCTNSCSQTFWYVHVFGHGNWLNTNVQKVRQISCGWRHTIAVTERENVYSWGRGANGQLWNGETIDPNVPMIIKAFSVDGSSGQHIESSKPYPTSGAVIGSFVMFSFSFVITDVYGKSLSSISKRYAIAPDETPIARTNTHKAEQNNKERIWSREVEVAHGSGGVEVNGTKVCAVTRLIGAACAVMGLVGAVLAPEEVVQAVPRRRGDGVLIVMAVRW